MSYKLFENEINHIFIYGSMKERWKLFSEVFNTNIVCLEYEMTNHRPMN
jgi:hypothetical protein